MVLLVDNYDSFVHNLARYVRELGHEALVRRTDRIAMAEVDALRPSHVILSPGPCGPADAGISTDLIRRFGGTIPILGVCLGHQCIGAAYGAEVVRAGRPRHGRTSLVVHDGSSVFAGLPSPFRATRYHSLVIAPVSLPPSLRVIARASDDGEIMAVEHRTHPVVGVQFHPESAATEHGYAILDCFLRGDACRAAALPTGADGADSVHRTPDTPPPWGSRWDETGDAFVPPPVDLVR
jgi:anthranilate synthase/aminodeoxychorismate synthase-like glutamine amidotransferase